MDIGIEIKEWEVPGPVREGEEPPRESEEPVGAPTEPVEARLPAV